MPKSYSVGFENVELVDGLGEDKPVWLYLRGTLYNEGDFDHPLWIGEVGGLPSDANRPAFDGFPVADAGRYVDHLIIGLATYQEIRGDSGCTGRLRYTRRDAQGTIIADVMLSRLSERLH